MATPTPKHHPIELDGRTLEGGGQLLRLALSLSSLTRTPLKVTDVRGNRSGGGGLKAQHLACVEWLAHASNATVLGAERGSKTLVFEPSLTRSDFSPAYSRRTLSDGRTVWDCALDIRSAGSTGLALQAVLPYILFAPPAPQHSRAHQSPVRLTLTGGTNVSGSPSYEYISQVLLPTLSSIGLPAISASLKKRGWSHGGSSIGSFALDIPPSATLPLPAFALRPADPTAAPAAPSLLQATFIGPSSCHAHLEAVLVPAIHARFGSAYTPLAGNLAITCEDSHHDKRLYLILVATVRTSGATPDSLDSADSADSTAEVAQYRLGKDWLYDRRIHSVERAAAEMAERAARDLWHEWASGAWVDEHMRDQLVAFQALARGRSEVFGGGREREPSLHARTAQWVAARMLGVRFDADDACVGVGYGGRVQDGEAELADGFERLGVD